MRASDESPGGWNAAPHPSLSVELTIPSTDLELHVANTIVRFLWRFLQSHPPYLEIEALLRSFPPGKRPKWPVLGLDDDYSSALSEATVRLSQRFSQFPWFRRWLHKRIEDDHPNFPPPDSVYPFAAKLGLVGLDIHIAAPIDTTWDTIAKFLLVHARPMWRQFQNDNQAPAGRNRAPLNPLLAAAWLFMSDFLGWSAAKIAHAQEDILTLKKRERATWLRLHGDDPEYQKWVDHFARANYEPESLIQWGKKKDPTYADHMVGKYLKRARLLLDRDDFDFRLPHIES